MKIATLLATASLAFAMFASAAPVTEAQALPNTELSGVTVVGKGVQVHFKVPPETTLVQFTIAGPREIMAEDKMHVFYTETGGTKQVLPVEKCDESIDACPLKRARATVIDDEIRRGNTSVDLSTVYVGSFVPTTPGEVVLELPKAILYGFAISVKMDTPRISSKYFHPDDEGKTFGMHWMCGDPPDPTDDSPC